MKNKIFILTVIIILALSTSIVFADDEKNLDETSDIYYEDNLLSFKGIPAKYAKEVGFIFGDTDIFLPIKSLGDKFDNVTVYSNPNFAIINVENKGNFYFFKDAEYYYYKNNKYYYTEEANLVESDTLNFLDGAVSSHNTFGKFILSKNNQLYIPHKVFLYITDKKYTIGQDNSLIIQGDYKYNKNDFYFLTRQINSEKDKENIIKEYSLKRYMNASTLPSVNDLRRYTKYKPNNDVLYFISTYFDIQESMIGKDLENIHRGDESKKYFYDLAEAEPKLYVRTDINNREVKVSFEDVKKSKIMTLKVTNPELNFYFRHIADRDVNNFLLDEYPDDYLEFYLGYYRMSPKEFLYSKTILKQIFPQSYEEIHNRLAGLYYEQDNAFEKYKKYTYDGKTFWITNPYWANVDTSDTAFSLVIAENDNFDYLDYIKNHVEYHY